MDSHSHYTTIRLTMFGIVLMSVMVSLAMAGKDKDSEECAEQLVGLATCLPYVGGDAKAPTPDCCNGLKQVLKDNKKCLCVIIKDRNDPELGLKINATLALSLPSVCHAPANVSQCPGKYLAERRLWYIPITDICWWLRYQCPVWFIDVRRSSSQPASKLTRCSDFLSISKQL